MRYNSLRNLSQFMSTDPATWNIESKELEKSYPYGAPTHAPTVGWLCDVIRKPNNCPSIQTFIESAKSTRGSSMRLNLEPGLKWFMEEVAPNLCTPARKVMSYNPRKPNPRFILDGQQISGGPHLRAHWHDKSERLIYFICTKEKMGAKRIQSILTLLQLYAVLVESRVPECIVLVDIRKQKVYERLPLDNEMVEHAISTIQRIKWFLENRDRA